MRKSVVPQSSTLTYLLGDHLGSTSLAVDASTGEVIETRYKPWGEVRYTTPNKTLPTRYSFTGQYAYTNDEATDLGNVGFGLMYYGARFYDPALGRFSSADSIIPEGSQGHDRYNYVNNRPTVNTDPSGHRPDDDEDKPQPCDESNGGNGEVIEDATLSRKNSSPYSQTIESKTQIVGTAQNSDLIQVGSELNYGLFDPSGPEYYKKAQKAMENFNYWGVGTFRGLTNIGLCAFSGLLELSEGAIFFIGATCSLIMDKVTPLAIPDVTQNGMEGLVDTANLFNSIKPTANGSEKTTLYLQVEGNSSVTIENVNTGEYVNLGLDSYNEYVAPKLENKLCSN